MFLMCASYIDTYRCMKQFSTDVVSLYSGLPSSTSRILCRPTFKLADQLFKFHSKYFFNQILFYSNTLLFKYFLFSGVFYIPLLRGEKWFAATLYIKH